jgi:(2R)-sulfolactate sulfo-lyase subunit alpha
MSSPTGAAAGPPQFLVHDAGDSVAVAVQDLAAGRVHGAVLKTGQPLSFPLRDQVPLGHKFAIADLAEGAEVTEYGNRVGITTAAIAVGEYVHVHNVRSARWPSRTAR